MPKSHSSFPTVWLLLLAAALAAAMLGCSMLGVVHFGWDEMWQSSIFWNLRAPRIVLSVLPSRCAAQPTSPSSATL